MPVRESRLVDNGPGRIVKTAWLCCICMVLLVPAPCFGVEFSQEETLYLQQLGKVTMCVDPDWVPFEHVDAQGQYSGIAADLITLVSGRAGIPFELVRTKNWDESVEYSREGKCQILSFLNQTPKRSEWLIFTEPMFSDPNVFITREEHGFITDPAELTDESIVFPTGTAMEERIRLQYPNLMIMHAASEDEAISMVSDRKAGMTMRSLIVAAYTIKKEGLFNLKIAGQLPNYTNHLRIGVRKELTMLRDILNKAVRTITPQERGQIVNRHVSINVQSAVSYKAIVYGGAVFGLLVSVWGYWTFRLNRLNAELRRISQTDTLTNLANRMMITSLFIQEMERTRRYNRPFSILLLDIDGFKAVNDEDGHLMGDQVLIAIGQLAQQSIRTTDRVGRWGGEEFLVVCPETDLAEAVRVGERICRAVREYAFAGGRRCTVSIGAAVVAPGDSEDTLLHRADTALYEAKRSGKDKVCTVV